MMVCECGEHIHFGERQIGEREEPRAELSFRSKPEKADREARRVENER